MVSGQGSLWHTENPTNIIDLRIFRPSELFVNVFKHATLPMPYGIAMHRAGIAIGIITQRPEGGQ